MGSGQPEVVGLKAAPLDQKWGGVEDNPMYMPGSVHWEADGNAKAFQYVKAQVLLSHGAPCYRTGTAGDVMQVQPVAPATSMKCMGVAVSDIAASKYGWIQCYGPKTYVNMISGTTQLANSYVMAAITSNAAEQTFESDTGTGGAGAFGYTLAEVASAGSAMQVYIAGIL